MSQEDCRRGNSIFSKGRLELNIELKLLNIDDSYKWLELQRETYKTYLDEYKNCEGHPAADTIDMIIARFKNPCCHFYFAYSNEIIVGGIRIIWHENSKEYEIADLFVLPNFQNAGNGKRIVEMTEAMYPDAMSWTLVTGAKEPRNHHFYKKLGYNIVEDIPYDKENITLFRKKK